MTSRRRLPIILAALLLGVLVGADAVVADTTYQDPAGAYQFTLPDGWQAFPGGYAILFLNGTTSDFFTVAPLPANGRSLADMTQDFFSENLTTDLGYQPDPAGMQERTVGGEPAELASYHSLTPQSGIPQTTMVVLTIHNYIRYLVGVLTTPEKEPTVISHPWDPGLLAVDLTCRRF